MHRSYVCFLSAFVVSTHSCRDKVQCCTSAACRACTVIDAGPCSAY